MRSPKGAIAEPTGSEQSAPLKFDKDLQIKRQMEMYKNNVCTVGTRNINSSLAFSGSSEQRFGQHSPHSSGS